MSGIAALFEPEELFGEYWHRWIGEVGSEQKFSEEAIDLNHVKKRLEIFFRGMGGARGVEIKPIAAQSVEYRRSFLARVGHGSTAVSRARFDGDFLFLPEKIELLNSTELNTGIYKWLVAWAAMIGNNYPPTCSDPLQNDIMFIRYCLQISKQILNDFPGIRPIYNQLLPRLLEVRITRKLPSQEAALEAAIRFILGDDTTELNGAEHHAINDAIFNDDQSLSHLKAHPGYKTFLPLILWGEVLPAVTSKPGQRQASEESSSEAKKPTDGRTRKATRQKSDQIEKKSSLLLHRFESILSWSEMMNIPRAVDDDDEDNAKRAADEQEEMGLANIARKASTKLKFDLDLAPEDVEHERIASTHVYREWDYRNNTYHIDHCSVLAASAPELTDDTYWQPDKAARQRIRAVKRQFEALTPRREKLLRQIDGNEIDMDALLRSKCDLAANGEGSNRIFSDSRESERDLSVSVLIDVSRSSESWIEGRQVLEISKEALMALSIGLTACGDNNAIYSFSSLKRDRVFVSTIKNFDENLGPKVFSRIGALRPGFYTRLGAAIRHVNSELSNTTSTKKLLLVITDGKPNDLDHYEGRYGIEDTAMAVREVRRGGTAVFGLTIDKQAQSYFPHIFGRNAFSIASHANDLTRALPEMYRHLVT